jgi:hypothetical protein
MHGVPATILDKPGPLSGSEYERMRMYSYYTERTWARPAALARIGAIAALGTERLDGSGCHRGLSSSDPGSRTDPGRGGRASRHDRTALIPPRTVGETGHRRAPSGCARRSAGPRGRRRRTCCRRATTWQAPQRSRGTHATGGRRADSRCPGRLDQAGGARAGHHSEDRRDPHRNGSTPRSVRPPARPPRCSRCARPAGHSRTSRLVGGTPDDTLAPRP